MLGKPVLVPAGVPTSLGSGIFALLAAGVYPSIEAAQEAVCLPLREVHPEPTARAVYDELYALYRSAYFALGSAKSQPAALGGILPALRRIAAKAR